MSKRAALTPSSGAAPVRRQKGSHMRRTTLRSLRTRSVAVVCLFTVLALAAAIGFAGCGEEAIPSPKSQIDIGKDASVKVSIRSVQTGIQAHVATTNALPPKATKDVLGGFVQPWPQNPWTKTDMTQGTGPGDYTYTPGAGTSYSLVVHLSGGRDYVVQ
jgi:hypothetical protein